MTQLSEAISRIDLRDIYKNGEVYKNISISDSLSARYNDYVVQEYRANQNRNHSYWHPSAFGTCGRKNIFDFYSEDPKTNLKSYDYVAMRSIEIFEFGHMVHHKFQNKLARIKDPHPILYGYWKCLSCLKITGKDSPPYGITKPSQCAHCGNENIQYEEVGVSNEEYNVGGHCDAIIKLSSNQEFQIIDFKTAGTYMWKEVIDGKNVPVNYHIVQLNAYMWLLDINSGYILYENRDKLIHKEFFVRRDEYIVDRIKHQLKYLNYHVSQGTVPPPNDPNFIAMSEVGPDKPTCKGYGSFGPLKLAPCKYYHLCWKQSFDESGGTSMYDGLIKIG